MQKWYGAIGIPRAGLGWVASHQHVVFGGKCSGSVGPSLQNWLDVSCVPDTVKKALQVVGETLEKTSALAARVL